MGCEYLYVFRMGQSQQPSGPREFIGPNSMINKTQYIRLIEQALGNLGYADVAAELERVSVRVEENVGHLCPYSCE